MPGAVSPAPVPAWIEKHVLSYSQFRVKNGLQKNLFTKRKGEKKMNREDYEELIKQEIKEMEERMETVEKFLEEVGSVELNLNHDGYEVTFSDVLKAYEILLKNGKIDL